MKEEVQLKDTTIKSFMRISSDSPVVIHWLEHKKKNVTLLSGDQETGKSSTLNAIMRMMGAAFGFNMKEIINRKDQTAEAEQSFTVDGIEYVASISGQRLSLKRFYKESGKYVPESSPVEMLQKIFGNLGIVPVELRSKKGKEQIEWFKENYGGEKSTKEEAKIEKAIAEAEENRKEVNKTITGNKNWLTNNKLYQNYEKNQKKFAVRIKADDQEANLKAITAKNSDYEKNKRGVEELKIKQEDKRAEIVELKTKLATLEQEEQKLATRIADGKKWLEDNKSTPVDYEKANKAWLNLSETLAEQTQWDEVLRKEKELQESEDLVIAATALLDTLRSDLRALTSTYLPKIQGLEIRTKSMSIDNGSEDEGIYFNGNSLPQLSESKYAEMWMQIWEDKKVKFVFIENISSYGSGFVKVLNDMVKRGVIKLYASEMHRGQKTMEISFETKIE